MYVYLIHVELNYIYSWHPPIRRGIDFLNITLSFYNVVKKSRISFISSSSTYCRLV